MSRLTLIKGSSADAILTKHVSIILLKSFENVPKIMCQGNLISTLHKEETESRNRFGLQESGSSSRGLNNRREDTASRISSC